MTLTYFTARSNLVTYAFLWEKVKTVDFSETIAAFDLKVGRCRQLIEIMKLCEYWRSRSFLYHIFSRFCMFCALLTSRYQVSVYRTNGPLVLIFRKQLDTEQNWHFLSHTWKSYHSLVSVFLLAHLSQRLICDLLVYPCPGVRPSSSYVVVHNFKHLLRNRLPDQSQILCGASLSRGNNILFAASGSHDQDGRHAHIYGKNPSKIFFSRTGGPIFTKLGI